MSCNEAHLLNEQDDAFWPPPLPPALRRLPPTPLASLGRKRRRRRRRRPSPLQPPTPPPMPRRSLRCVALSALQRPNFSQGPIQVLPAAFGAPRGHQYARVSPRRLPCTDQPRPYATVRARIHLAPPNRNAPPVHATTPTCRRCHQAPIPRYHERIIQIT